jgi:hypothetical protein
MARVCVRHPFELSDNFCSHCGLEYCRDCIVYPKGPKKPGLCHACALAASGVRSSAATQPPISKRELKRRMKERREEDRVLALHDREPEPISPITNPFSSGWAVGSDDATVDPLAEREPVAVPPPPPPPPPPPAPTARDDYVHTEAPTLADLLPTVPPARAPANEHALSVLAELHVRAPEPELERDPEPEPDEDRRLRSLPMLRRRDPEPADDGAGASEMIAWLDEVFAPRDER